MSSTAEQACRYLPPLIVGGGNMARAIVEGAGRGGLGVFRGGVVVEPDVVKHAVFTGLGMSAFASIPAAIEQVDGKGATAGGGTLPILLAVKPQMLGDVARELAPRIAGREVLVISILAGTTIERIGGMLGTARIVRAMPNLPASIGKGATAITACGSATAEDVELARAIFSAVGPLVVPLDEGLMDAFTALAGSGPAYLYYLAEAMTRAGVAAGFDRGTSEAIVRQTLGGAGALLEGSDLAAADLRAAVTSRGGTTAAATGVLDARGVMEAVVEAIIAGRDRGRELGKL